MTIGVVRSVFATGIGAFELKRYYQKHMFLGTIISSGAALAIVGMVMLYTILQTQAVEAVHVVRIKTLAELAPPPSMTARPPQIQVAQPKIAPPSIGIPTPVPDEEVGEEVKFATRAELAQLTAPIQSASDLGGGGDSIVIDIPDDEFMPAPDEFVAVEEMPVQVYEEHPGYPEMAERAGIEGVVWVRALVDKDGRVRDAIVQKASGTNAGFEEAALEAAFKNRYKPAIQNGRPIPVWVSYRVVFELK
jgi:protein TonB